MIAFQHGKQWSLLADPDVQKVACHRAYFGVSSPFGLAALRQVRELLKPGRFPYTEVETYRFWYEPVWTDAFCKKRGKITTVELTKREMRC